MLKLCAVGLILLISGTNTVRTSETEKAPGEPVALVGGRAVTAADLDPALFEAAGAVVLEETALGQLIEEELAAGGLSVSPAQVEAERALLLSSIGAETGSNPEQAATLVENLRRSRGLGDTRFGALLRRNAGLRALTQGRVKVSEEDLRLARQLQFGPRYRVRLLTTPSREGADQALRALRAECVSPVALPVVFAEQAMERSADASAPRGGLYPEASAVEVTLPAAVRLALATIPIGQCSDVLGIEGGYAIALVEGVSRAEVTPTPAQEDSLRAKVLMRLQRIEMDRLARSLLDRAKVTALDGSLRWSWERRPR